MSQNDTDGSDPSTWSRRAVLGAAVATPALVLASAGRADAARVRDIPPDLQDIIKIGNKVSLFTGIPGPIPNGIRLSLTLSVPPAGTGTLIFDKLFLPNLGELTTFNPTEVFLTRAQTITLDVGPVLPGQLRPTFVVVLVFTYQYAEGEYNEINAPQQVTVVPLQALPRSPRPPKAPKPPKPPKPPKL